MNTSFIVLILLFFSYACSNNSVDNNDSSSIDKKRDSVKESNSIFTAKNDSTQKVVLERINKNGGYKMVDNTPDGCNALHWRFCLNKPHLDSLDLAVLIEYLTKNEFSYSTADKTCIHPLTGVGQLYLTYSDYLNHFNVAACTIQPLNNYSPEVNVNKFEIERYKK